MYNKKYFIRRCESENFNDRYKIIVEKLIGKEKEKKNKKKNL